MKNIITVCYGQKKEWTSREEAKIYFLEGMMNSEGSERERYTSTYLKLISGEMLCTDEEEDDNDGYSLS